MISPLAYVDPDAIIGSNVTIHPFAYIDKNVVIGDNNEIMPYASILNGARIGNGNRIFQQAIISSIPQDFEYKGDLSEVIIGDNNVIREKVIINRATNTGNHTYIGNRNFILQGVQIGHDTHISDDIIIGNNTLIAGSCMVHNKAIISNNVIMNQNCRIGSWSLIQGGCRFNRDVPPYIIAAKEPIVYSGVNAPIMNRHGFLREEVESIASAYRLLFHYNTSLEDAIHRIQDQLPPSPHIDYIVQFLKESDKLRGIIKSSFQLMSY